MGVAAANVAGIRESKSYFHCEIYVFAIKRNVRYLEVIGRVELDCICGRSFSCVVQLRHSQPPPKQSASQLLHMTHTGHGSANLDIAEVAD